jgi:hypothetical protein
VSEAKTHVTEALEVLYPWHLCSLDRSISTKSSSVAASEPFVATWTRADHRVHECSGLEISFAECNTMEKAVATEFWREFVA